MRNISFEKAKHSDALRISILFKTIYIQTYASEGVSFELSNYIEKRFSKEHIEKIILENPEQLIIAYCNNNPIGVAEIHFNSKCSIRNIAIPELDKLYVLERFYGKGIGQGLIEAVETLVQSKGYKELNLEVYIENLRAISFYKKHGYQTIGQVDFPMEFNTYENLVMNKSLES